MSCRKRAKQAKISEARPNYVLSEILFFWSLAFPRTILFFQMVSLIIHHNFTKPHMVLEGSTPAQVNGLEARGWKEIFEKAIATRKGCQRASSYATINAISHLTCLTNSGMDIGFLRTHLSSDRGNPLFSPSVSYADKKQTFTLGSIFRISL